MGRDWSCLLRKSGNLVEMGIGKEERKNKRLQTRECSRGGDGEPLQGRDGRASTGISYKETRPGVLKEPDLLGAGK